MSTLPATELPAEAELREALDSLLATWDLGRDSVHIKGLDAAQFGLIYGMAAQTHRSCKSALLLMDQDLAPDAIGLTRVAYENALTAMWTLLVPDGAHALILEAERQRELTKSVADRAYPGSPHTSESITIDELETSSQQAAKRIIERCKDLDPGRDEAYFIYRFLSPYLHANAITADRYLYADPEYPVAPTLRTDPHLYDMERWLALYALVIALLWAGQAVDERMQGHPRRSQLKRVAKGLRINLDLRLSGAAFQRVFQSEKARRRASRASRK